jgi:ADP-ribose pyrophosphatase
VSGPGEDGEQGNGFRVVRRDTVWTGQRIRAESLKAEAPDGSIIEREAIRHPGAVGVVPLHDDGSVTLVRQYRVVVDLDMWEVPAGLRDVEGEPTAETAQRELIEEAGLRAERLDLLVRFHNSPGFADEVVEVYLARGLSDVPDDRQGIEEQHMVVDRVPLDEALAMVDDGRITDAKTVIALLATERHLRLAGSRTTS